MRHIELQKRVQRTQRFLTVKNWNSFVVENLHVSGQWCKVFFNDEILDSLKMEQQLGSLLNIKSKNTPREFGI